MSGTNSVPVVSLDFFLLSCPLDLREFRLILSLLSATDIFLKDVTSKAIVCLLKGSLDNVLVTDGEQEDGLSCELGDFIEPHGEILRDLKAGDINILLTGLGDSIEDEQVDDAGEGC